MADPSLARLAPSVLQAQAQLAEALSGGFEAHHCPASQALASPFAQTFGAIVAPSVEVQLFPLDPATRHPIQEHNPHHHCHMDF